MTIEEFNIKIGLVDGNTESRLSKIKRAYKEFKAGVKQGVQEAIAEQEALNDSIEETEKVTEKAAKQQNSFWKKIKEMALGSFIFNKISQAIQKIADAYKEGVNNVYLFAKANDLAFANIMDSWSSKITAVKNAIGALVATFITAIEPYIEKILEFLVELFNQLSLFFSRLFKIDAILAKSDILKEWAQNNKETQKTLQLLSGFDTLTIFDNSNSSESTTDETAAKDMFITQEYDGQDPWVELKAYFKELWDKIKTWWNGYVIYTTDEETGQKRILDQQEGMVDKLKKIGDKILDWFLGEDPDTGATGVFQRYIIPYLQDNFWDDISNAISSIANSLVDLGTNLAKRIKEALESVDWGTFFKKFIIGDNTTYKKTDGNILNRAYDENGNYKSNIWNDFFDNQKRFWQDVGDIFTGVFSQPIYGLTKFASGGVITSPTVGLIGEYSGAANNPELITPTSLLDQRLQANNNSLLNGYNVIAQQIISAIKDVDMKVSIGDDVIANSCSRGNSNYNKMTGRSLF